VDERHPPVGSFGQAVQNVRIEHEGAIHPLGGLEGGTQGRVVIEAQVAP
jgi:hypothetical protein